MIRTTNFTCNMQVRSTTLLKMRCHYLTSAHSQKNDLSLISASGCGSVDRTLSEKNRNPIFPHAHVLVRSILKKKLQSTSTLICWCCGIIFCPSSRCDATLQQHMSNALQINALPFDLILHIYCFVSHGTARDKDCSNANSSFLRQRRNYALADKILNACLKRQVQSAVQESVISIIRCCEMAAVRHNPILRRHL